MQNFILYSIILLHFRQVELFLFLQLTEFKYYKIIYTALSGLLMGSCVLFVLDRSCWSKQQVVGLALIGQGTQKVTS